MIEEKPEKRQVRTQTMFFFREKANAGKRGQYWVFLLNTSEQWPKPRYLLYVGDYTTQLHRDSNKPLSL